MNALQHAWAARAPRERVALGLAGGVLLAAALWVWAIEPLITAGARAEKRLPELHRQAAEIDRLAKQAGELRAQAASPVATPAPEVLAASARAAGLAVQIEAGAPGEYPVRVERAAMAALQAWLASLAAEPHLFVREARLDPLADGQVTGQLVLGR